MSELCKAPYGHFILQFFLLSFLVSPLLATTGKTPQATVMLNNGCYLFSQMLWIGLYT